jgi:hypothetical protein
MPLRLMAGALAALVLVVSSLASKPLPEARKGESQRYYIALLPKANMKLTDGLGSGIESNNLAELPKGEQTFAKRAFKIENGLIHLSGTLTKDKPAKVEGIKVDRRFAKIHILHGTCWGGTGEEADENLGMLIGEYRIQYDDKTTAQIPIEYGKDVRDWWDWDKGRAVTRGTLAWQGTNDSMKNDDMKIRLYVTTWQNPHPRKLITAIDYHSSNTLCAPFCVAMTGE